MCLKSGGMATAKFLILKIYFIGGEWLRENGRGYYGNLKLFQ